jgi:hypothetical protein
MAFLEVASGTLQCSDEMLLSEADPADKEAIQ